MQVEFSTKKTFNLYDFASTKTNKKNHNVESRVVTEEKIPTNTGKSPAKNAPKTSAKTPAKISIKTSKSPIKNTKPTIVKSSTENQIDKKIITEQISPHKEINEHPNEKTTSSSIIDVVDVIDKETITMSKNNNTYNSMLKAGEIIVDMAKKVDLHAINHHVLHYFDEKETKIQKLRRRQKILSSEDTDSVEDELRIQDELEIINNECHNLANKLKDREKYINESKSLLQQHDDLLPNTNQQIIGSDEYILSPQDCEELELIVNEFVDLAQNFVKINVKRQYKNITMCFACNAEPVLVDGKLRCPFCNKKIKPFDANLRDRGNGLMNNDYHRSDTFEDIIDSFQGEQTWLLSDKIWLAIDLYCEKYHIDRIDLNKEDIYNILKLNGLSEHYNDINLIAHKTSNGNIPLPDIAIYKDTLIYRHRLIEEEFELIKEKDEKNFLRGQYVLWMLLEMEGYKCNISDFKMLETRDVIIRHDQKLKQIATRLKISHPEFNWEFRGLA